MLKQILMILFTMNLETAATFVNVRIPRQISDRFLQRNRIPLARLLANANGEMQLAAAPILHEIETFLPANNDEIIPRWITQGNIIRVEIADVHQETVGYVLTQLRDRHIIGTVQGFYLWHEGEIINAELPLEAYQGETLDLIAETIIPANTRRVQIIRNDLTFMVRLSLIAAVFWGLTFVVHPIINAIATSDWIQNFQFGSITPPNPSEINQPAPKTWLEHLFHVDWCDFTDDLGSCVLLSIFGPLIEVLLYVVFALLTNVFALLFQHSMILMNAITPETVLFGIVCSGPLILLGRRFTLEASRRLPRRLSVLILRIDMGVRRILRTMLSPFLGARQ